MVKGRAETKHLIHLGIHSVTYVIRSVMGFLYVHHLNTQISPPFDSYINKQTVPVCIDANSSSIYFTF